VKTIEVRESDGVEDTRQPCDPAENTEWRGCGVRGLDESTEGEPQHEVEP
jgi:hypothetical protein